MLNSLRHIMRLFVIGRTLARHDALFVLAEVPATRWIRGVLRLTPGLRPMRAAKGLRDGERLAAALQALGPSFIKLGQALSTRADIFGERFAEDLSALQDRLPPFPADAARAAIEDALGRPIDVLFASFEDTPVAAASIAQVHFAEVADEHAPLGETPATRAVAVKILRPGIEAAFERDLRLFLWLARIVERAQPRLRRLKPVEAVEMFAETVRAEMDLRLEAAAAMELAENFAARTDFMVPAVDWGRTARRVLTTERVEGTPLHEIEALRAAGHDLEDLVRRSAGVFFEQVFRDGFFHGDMHPGNLFVAADGTIIPVDFGIMGRLDRRTRDYLADMLVGFLRRDYARVAAVHFRAGYVPGHKSRDAFCQACRAIGEPIFERPTHEISVARLLAQLFQMTERFDMEAQPQLLLLQKTMLLAEGVGRKLAPHANMWLLARPLIEEWMREHRGPEARVTEAVASVGAAMGMMVEQLPALMDRIQALAAAPAPAPAPRFRAVDYALPAILLVMLGAALAALVLI